MYNRIWQNSYVALVISFIILCIICYLFGIGSTTEVQYVTKTENGKQILTPKVVKKFSWKYPLAISLLVWVIWHFYLYPPHEEIEIQQPVGTLEVPNNPAIIAANLPRSCEMNNQKINLNNWN